MIKIKDIVIELQDKNTTTSEIADVLGVTASQVAKYRQEATKIPSINVAIEVYLHKQVAVFPYAEEAILELIKEK